MKIKREYNWIRSEKISGSKDVGRRNEKEERKKRKKEEKEKEEGEVEKGRCVL